MSPLSFPVLRRLSPAEFSFPCGAAALSLLLGLSCPQSTQAQRIWANTGTDFNAGASWSGGVAPTGSDFAQFTSGAGTNPNLSSNASFGRIHFTTTGASGYTFTANPTFGFTMNVSTPFIGV